MAQVGSGSERAVITPRLLSAVPADVQEMLAKLKAENEASGYTRAVITPRLLSAVPADVQEMLAKLKAENDAAGM